MLNTRRICLTVALLFVFVADPLAADVISTSYSGSVTSVFKTLSDSQSSTLSTAALFRRVAADNSFTETALNWQWDGTTLAGNSSLTAAKTVSARPGGDHQSSSDLVFTFTIDSRMDLSFGGVWGFSTVQGINDLLMLELTGPTGVITTDTSTGTTGVASDSFSYSGTLNPGTYSLTLSGDLVRTINNATTLLGGWSLNQFSLVNSTAVPESSGLVGSWLWPCLAVLNTDAASRTTAG